MNLNMIHILMIMILTPHHLNELGGLDEFGGNGLCIEEMKYTIILVLRSMT